MEVQRAWKLEAEAREQAMQLQAELLIANNGRAATLMKGVVRRWQGNLYSSCIANWRAAAQKARRGMHLMRRTMSRWLNQASLSTTRSAITTWWSRAEHHSQQCGQIALHGKSAVQATKWSLVQEAEVQEAEVQVATLKDEVAKLQARLDQQKDGVLQREVAELRKTIKQMQLESDKRYEIWKRDGDESRIEFLTLRKQHERLTQEMRETQQKLHEEASAHQELQKAYEQAALTQTGMRLEQDEIKKLTQERDSANAQMLELRMILASHRDKQHSRKAQPEPEPPPAAVSSDMNAAIVIDKLRAELAACVQAKREAVKAAEEVRGEFAEYRAWAKQEVAKYQQAPHPSCSHTTLPQPSCETHLGEAEVLVGAW